MTSPVTADILDNAEIVQSGDLPHPESGEYFIGEHPSIEKNILMWKIGGSIAIVQLVEFVHGPSEKIDREINLPDDWEHISKHDLTRDEVREAIENAHQVWETADQLWYFYRLPNGKVIVVKVFKSTMTVSTAYPMGEKVQDAGQALQDRIEEKYYNIEKIYDHRYD